MKNLGPKGWGKSITISMGLQTSDRLPWTRTKGLNGLPRISRSCRFFLFFFCFEGFATQGTSLKVIFFFGGGVLGGSESGFWCKSQGDLRDFTQEVLIFVVLGFFRCHIKKTLLWLVNMVSTSEQRIAQTTSLKSL